MKRPLLSVAKIAKAGNQVYLSEDKVFVKNNKRADHKPSSRAQRVDALLVGKETS